MAGSAAFTRSITASVEASLRLVTCMYTVRLPLTWAYPVMMSVPFSMTPMSFKYTAGLEPGRTGASISSGRLPPSDALLDAMRVSSPMRTLPDGITADARFTAAIASSGEMR